MYANKAYYLVIALSIFIAVLGAPGSSVQAQADTELAGFSTVWKLMSAADKEQFISGYLRGWKDASEFLDITVEYLRTNPGQAADALSKLRDVSQMADQKPAPLSNFIDKFYKDPQNLGAPLSKAVSAAKASGLLEVKEGQ